VDHQVIDSIRAGDVEIVPAVDGSVLEPDAVICATGYRCGLESVVGHLDVLDELGRPRIQGERPAAPGLRFIGYVPRPGALGYWGRQAKRAARAIARELRVGA
jgi:hypothetical protein